jgi:hypothetical protein
MLLDVSDGVRGTVISDRESDESLPIIFGNEEKKWKRKSSMLRIGG